MQIWIEQGPQAILAAVIRGQAPQELMMMLWGLYREDKFQKIQMSCLRGASGYLLVAGGARPDTLDKAIAIKDEADQQIGTVRFVVLNI